jgi:hypothetical protein
MPHSNARGRFDNLLPFQVFSCWNGVTVLDASLFQPPSSLRFRSNNGTDTHSECYLLCSDIWKDKSPLNIDGTPRPGQRGARIQVIPRTSVAYGPDEYEKARQDRNTTAWEVDGVRLERALDQEMVKWKLWPPKLIQNYPLGKLALQLCLSNRADVTVSVSCSILGKSGEPLLLLSRLADTHVVCGGQQLEPPF